MEGTVIDVQSGGWASAAISNRMIEIVIDSSTSETCGIVEDSAVVDGQMARIMKGPAAPITREAKGVL